MNSFASRLRSRIVEARNTAMILRNAPKLVPWAQSSPATYLAQWAEHRGHQDALRFEDTRFSWAEVNNRANQWAGYFRNQGITAGDVVAIAMTNRPEFLFSLLGLNKLGAVGALINHNLRGKDLRYALAIARPQKILAGGELLDPVLEVAGDVDGINPRYDVYVEIEGQGAEIAVDEADPERGIVINRDLARTPPIEMAGAHSPRNSDVCCYVYTSGTTGLPKAARITNQRVTAAGFIFGETMLEAGPGACTYVCLPLYHSSALFIGFGSTLATGGTVALARKFSASKFWDEVVAHDATAILYIGELCRYLLNTDQRDSEHRHRVRVAVGNGLRPDIWEDFQRRFGVPVMREFYAATEGNAPTFNFEGKPGMIGRKRSGQVIVRCDLATGDLLRNREGFCDRVGEGEVGLFLGRISPVMKFDGYLDKSATSKKIVTDVFKKGDAYFNTGDLVKLHEDGWLSFADRIGDTFRWKGENVSTNEVGETLNGADGVLEANVYGVAVPQTDGRAGMAAITADETFDIQGLARFAVEHLPNYQRPYFVRVLEGGMRTTSTLKHQKVDYRTEGFDPARVSDPLYFLDGDRYIPIDSETFARIQSGELSPR